MLEGKGASNENPIGSEVMRQILHVLLAGEEVFVPPGICSVGTASGDRKSSDIYQAQMQQGGGSKKPTYRTPDERFHEHAPKEQQVDHSGSTGKKDLGYFVPNP